MTGVIENIVPGAYLKLSQDLEEIMTKFPSSWICVGRLHEYQGHQAITMGPVVLSLAIRGLSDGFVDETAVIQSEQSVVNLTPIASKPPHIWMAFSVDGLTGTDLEGTGKIAKPIHFL
jgi:hypothetical protein